MPNEEPTFNPLSMSGKTALITGSSSGLGRHFAKVLSAAGASVVVGARRIGKLNELVAEIENEDRKALAVELDVNEANSIQAAFDAAEDRFGTVTTLINNAGAGGAKRFLEIDEDFWNFSMDTNVKSIWRMSTAFGQRVKTAGTGGSIVNISSIYGLQVASGSTAYSTSKSAALTMTKTMALDLARFGIRTNAICPGHFLTEMTTEFLTSDAGLQVLKQTPMRRAGKLSELDIPLLLLCSDAGSYINGATLTIDGGTVLQGL